jgi:hypothetical protein
MKDSLQAQIDELQHQLNYSRMTLDTYYQLHNIGFGLKELKQLYGTLVEISTANKIKIKELMSKFCVTESLRYLFPTKDTFDRFVIGNNFYETI